MFIFTPTPVLDDPLYKIGKFPSDDESIDNLVQQGDKIMAESGEEGRVGFETTEVRPDCRRAKVAWLREAPQNHWIYMKLMNVILDANARWFHFDLAGIHDALQYTVYESAQQGHFDWHLDMGDKYGGPQRKLSLSLLLTNPSEYEGGDFEVMDGAHPRKMEVKDKGTVIIFPSYVLHRVTPVTKGTRKALVAWVCGPKFR